jgi:intracellular sulfur oxidation DsrE/DsrF family protein
MNRDDPISEERLNAFTDGELDAEEENDIFGQSEVSPELDARLCQQRRLKEMVRHAYRDVPEYRRGGDPGSARRRRFGLAAAAMVLLAVGAMAGFLGGRAAVDGREMAALAVAEQPETWLLHLTSSDPRRMQAALERADELMNDPEASMDRQVEIVANEGGLDLLRSDVTPHAARIRELADQDVLFFACARAVERLRERGVEVELVPEADAHYTALDRVVKRMNAGWQYEKI